MIAPGSLVAISGQKLAAGNAVSSGYPLPTGLSGVSLKAAGRAVPLPCVLHADKRPNTLRDLRPGHAGGHHSERIRHYLYYGISGGRRLYWR